MGRLLWKPHGPQHLVDGLTTQRFTRGQVNVLIGREDGRWHLSISTPTRYPTWDEIADARYDLLPDALEMAMILPPKAHYVNHHPYVFHLWEMHDPEMPIEREPTGYTRSRLAPVPEETQP